MIRDGLGYFAGRYVECFTVAVFPWVLLTEQKAVSLDELPDPELIEEDVIDAFGWFVPWAVALHYLYRRRQEKEEANQ